MTETLTVEQYRAATAPAKPSKYRNKPTKVNGTRFASKREANRFVQLQTLERAGLISNLKRQVAYDLAVNGVHVTRYVADFEYEEAGRPVTEDAKGVATPAYVIKRALMKAIFEITIRET